MVFLFWIGSLPAVDVLLDAPGHHALPANFRTVLDPFRVEDGEPTPSKAGFKKLRASGSAQFSAKGLEAIIAKLDVKKLAIVDLRQESHGHVNDMALSWHEKGNGANQGKNLRAVQKTEDRLLKKAAAKNKIRMKNDRSQSSKIVTVHRAVNEQLLTKNYDLQYLRIPVQDNCGPTAEDINRFIDFVKQMPKGTWIHFHCKLGYGRTTTFMAIYDMLCNAKKVSLTDIRDRHLLIGGMDILAMPKDGDFFYDCQVARRSIIVQFYNYCNKNKDDYKTPFTLKW
jgi:predicted protein tyrosine phosphatase